MGSSALGLDEVFIAARNPGGDNLDFALSEEAEALAPGDAVKMGSSIVVDARK